MSRLPDEMVAFLQIGIAHQIGGCDPQGRPSVSRALGATVADDGRVVVLISGECGYEVLEAIRLTGRVSAVFVQPSTFRALHLKGIDARVEPAGDEYRELLATRRASFLGQLQPYGFTDDYLAAWYTVPDGALMQVRFTPNGAWNQTPGPGAGDALVLRGEGG